MLFSIIVPVYNTEKYIEQCIDSIIDQTVSNWELILVDDGSTDSSSTICDKYASSNTRIHVIHKTNEGVSVARKIGCKEASGDYVMFVDSDDWIDKHCIEKLSNTLVGFQVDIIKFAMYREDEDGTFLKVKLRHQGLFEKERIKTDIYPYLIHNDKADYYASAIWGGAFRLECIFPYMIEDRKAAIGEDSACVIPAVYHCNSMFFLDENLYYYRYNEQSATKSRKVFEWDNPKIIAEHLRINIDTSQFDFEMQVNRRIVHDLFNVCLTQFYRNDGYKVVKKDILNHLKDPIYSSAIKKAKFKFGSKAWLMWAAMNKRSIWVMKQVAYRHR